LDGYCKGSGEDTFLFYGGVCGMTAQLFRIALIHPDIQTTKRRPHNERFVQYYGENISGDDAAIYEMSKQFEIKNIGNQDIYFKVRQEEGQTSLIAISAHRNKYVQITKHPINALRIDLERTVREQTKSEKSDPIRDQENKLFFTPQSVFSTSTPPLPTLVQQETFSSRYLGKNYEFR
jgi:hypothetical protein